MIETNTTVLVDSSIWISGLGLRAPLPLKIALINLLETDRAAVTQMVRLEVLGGARSLVELDRFRSDFDSLHCFEITDKDWRRAEDLSFSLNRKGKRVPTGDILIASIAISKKMPLWHADSDFERIKEVIPDFQTFWYPKQYPN